jgi:hypothetical protein
MTSSRSWKPAFGYEDLNDGERPRHGSMMAVLGVQALRCGDMMRGITPLVVPGSRAFVEANYHFRLTL